MVKCEDDTASPQKIELTEDLKSRRGLAVSLEIICHNCGESTEDSMNAAVHEAVIANDNNSNIAVAVDGTWHKRGYSSLNGVVCATSVENGKVIDFEALTKYCSSSTRGLSETNHVLLNHGQVTWTTLELVPLSPNYHTTPTGGRFSSRQI
ncbi:hypothetical protein TNCV_3035281 [Trichonephila clavipes]|nr:hypothetical protein TNCV_3035281 [Trichonephila clavipes]